MNQISMMKNILIYVKWGEWWFLYYTAIDECVFISTWWWWIKYLISDNKKFQFLNTDSDYQHVVSNVTNKYHFMPGTILINFLWIWFIKYA